MQSINIKGVKLRQVPEDVVPKCPYCKEDLNEIGTKSKMVSFRARTILLCPHCKTFLGYGSF